MVDKKWMIHSPQHVEVPVVDAKPIQERLYRFVSNEKPNKVDFFPSCTDPRQSHMWSKRNLMPAYHGTSFFKTEKSAINKREERPQAFVDLSLAVGDIENIHGVAKASKSGHVTLWFYKGIFPQGFTLV